MLNDCHMHESFSLKAARHLWYSASRYERAGFKMALHLPQFYSIRGERFDAYLYVLYLWPPAGARGSSAQQNATSSAVDDQKTPQPGLLRDWI